MSATRRVNARAISTIVIALTLSVGVAIGAVDVLAPFGGLALGSASAIMPGAGLQLLADDPTCRSAGTPCPARYAFAPDRELNVWISVRNDSATDLTVDGVAEWIGSMPPNLLVRPIATLDGGDLSRGFTGIGAPFDPIVLRPHAERLIGIRLRTISDLRFACEHWAPGTAIGFGEVPVAWHWMARQHSAKIAMRQAVQVAAPSAAECQR